MCQEQNTLFVFSSGLASETNFKWHLPFLHLDPPPLLLASLLLPSPQMCLTPTHLFSILSHSCAEANALLSVYLSFSTFPSWLLRHSWYIHNHTFSFFSSFPSALYLLLHISPVCFAPKLLFLPLVYEVADIWGWGNNFASDKGKHHVEQFTITSYSLLLHLLVQP